MADVFLDFVVFVLMNVFISGIVLLDIKDIPGWAFERAHRGSKRFWLVAWIISIFVPFGCFFYMFAYGWARKAVKPARDIGDPDAAEEERRRTEEMRRRRYQLDKQARDEYNAQRPIGSQPWQGLGPPPMS